MVADHEALRGKHDERHQKEMKQGRLLGQGEHGHATLYSLARLVITVKLQPVLCCTDGSYRRRFLKTANRSFVSCVICTTHCHYLFYALTGSLDYDMFVEPTAAGGTHLGSLTSSERMMYSCTQQRIAAVGQHRYFATKTTTATLAWSRTTVTR